MASVTRAAARRRATTFARNLCLSVMWTPVVLIEEVNQKVRRAVLHPSESRLKSVLTAPGGRPETWMRDGRPRRRGRPPSSDAVFARRRDEAVSDANHRLDAQAARGAPPFELGHKILLRNFAACVN